MLSDAEIAAQAELKPIAEIAANSGLDSEAIEPYGRYLAKVPWTAVPKASRDSKYILVSAVTPTPLGEGKTTTAVGLAQGLAQLGKNAVLTLRQPSLGPTLGIKGGAAGGGYSQVIPMDKMNLHLTGDFHAVTAAHNLLAAMIDAHLHHGNELNIDPHSITWRRVIDLNDRALRNVIVGLGRKVDGVPRQTGFDITAASEIMVLLSLAKDLQDLRQRLGRIVIGQTYDKQPVTAEDLKAAGAMAVLLSDAISPNLLQTLEHTPVLVHTGPFGNIATGASSIIADQMGSQIGDYVISEAGFGADMGAERAINVKLRLAQKWPDAVVIVVTVRALKAHSGKFKIVPGKPIPEALLAEDPEAVQAGRANLEKHIEIIKGFGLHPVVAINVFHTDHESELAVIEEIAEKAGVAAARSTHVVAGGKGALALAQAVMDTAEKTKEPRHTYELSQPLSEKITAIATKVYGADKVELSAAAKRDLALFESWGYQELPVVIAKTHLSLSHDRNLLGAPTGWTLPIREVRLAAGAGYVYAIASDMQTMPGLSKYPAAQKLDIDENGNPVGLF